MVSARLAKERLGLLAAQGVAILLRLCLRSTLATDVRASAQLKVMRLAVTVALVWVSSMGCKTIALNDDPDGTAAHEADVTPPHLFDVAWSAPLVKTGLLEYQPAETATPAVDPDSERVIVSTRDGVVHCLSGKDGHQEWSLSTHGRPFAGAWVRDGVAYIPGGDGVLYAVRVTSGETLWRSRLPRNW